MSFYIYNDRGENVAVVYADDIIEAKRDAKFLGFGDCSIERA